MNWYETKAVMEAGMHFREVELNIKTFPYTLKDDEPEAIRKLYAARLSARKLADCLTTMIREAKPSKNFEF